MIYFIIKKVTHLITTMLVVSFIVFVLNEYSPGQVARKVLGQFATQNQVDILTEQMGLNRSVFIRYGEWLLALLKGDLGTSVLWGTPVAPILGEKLCNTLLLAAVSFVVLVPLSIVLGIIAGMREASTTDRVISLFSIIATSVPVFASGVFLQIIFVVWLGVLPGTSPLEFGGDWSIASQLVLPVLVIVLNEGGYVVRIVRASMVETMSRPFIRTAVLKGLDFRKVILKHAVRNAMIGPFTVILLQINFLITGVVVVEAVFGFPGFGRMMLDAALNKDIAVIEAGSLVAVFIAVATQVLGDIGYVLLNPRIRVA